MSVLFFFVLFFRLGPEHYICILYVHTVLYMHTVCTYCLIYNAYCMYILSYICILYVHTYICILYVHTVLYMHTVCTYCLIYAYCMYILIYAYCMYILSYICILYVHTVLYMHTVCTYCLIYAFCMYILSYIFVCLLVCCSGLPVPCQTLYNQLQGILDDQTPPSSHPLGCLTGLDRDRWAQLRNDLRHDNLDLLEAIDSALLVLCLDDATPTSPEELTHQMLHNNCRNRWRLHATCAVLVVCNVHVHVMCSHFHKMHFSWLLVLQLTGSDCTCYRLYFFIHFNKFILQLFRVGTVFYRYYFNYFLCRVLVYICTLEEI